ncbi:MAG TPA: hypothetical protein VGX48_03215 [Pyrinomonadaceae bacterium]|jgi:hypothetical protein|nr:hypothetical protein [Pyrinomonadaceae bacterium]
MAHGKRKRDSIHETPDVSYITNPDVAHEVSDVAVRPLLWFVFGLTVFTLAMAALMYLTFIVLEKREQAAERRPSPLARRGDETLPPEPRLQLAPGFGVTTEQGQRVPLSYDAEGKTDRAPGPESEYLIVREEWDRKLTTYGWADQQAGTVRVPIDRAMRAYAERQRAKRQAQQPGSTQPGAQQQLPQPAPSPAPGTQPSQSSSGQQSERQHP